MVLDGLHAETGRRQVKLVFNDSEGVTEWVLKEIGFPPGFFGKTAAIGVSQGGEPVAGVVYHDFHADPWGLIYQCQMSVANTARGLHVWLRPEFMSIFFGYAFNDVGVRVIRNYVARGNKRSRKFTEHCGFRYEGMAREGWPLGGDAAVYSLLRKECKYLEEQNGR